MTLDSPLFGRQEGSFEAAVGDAVVVLDAGSGLVKCGFAGDRKPRAIFDPCAAHRPGRDQDQRERVATEFGNSGRSWADVQTSWEQAFNDQLHIDPEEHRLLLADTPLSTPALRHRAVQSALETHGFSGVHLQAQATLSLFSVGETTGLVVDIGEDATNVVAVVDGNIMWGHSRRLPVGGRHLTERLREMMQYPSVVLRDDNTPQGRISLSSARAAKERLCYVAPDVAKESLLARNTTAQNEQFKLPDGRRLTLGPERWRAPEALFSPELVGCEAYPGGIVNMAVDCITDSAMDVRRRLLDCIVLCGGTSTCPGLAGRMQAEVAALHAERLYKGAAPSWHKPAHVDASPGRAHSVYSGGAVLGGSKADQPEFWVTRQEWEEDPHRAMMRMSTLGLW